MRRRWSLVLVGLVGAWCVSSAGSAIAQYPERIVEQNGVLYRETTVVDRRPVTEVEWQEQVQYSQLPQHFTTLREEYRWVSVPVVEYQFQAWPQGGGQWVPVTRWEQRQQRVRYPVNGIETVTEARRVQTPVRKLSFVEAPRVERVALTPNAPPPPVYPGEFPANYPAGYPAGYPTNAPATYPVNSAAVAPQPQLPRPGGFVPGRMAERKELSPTWSAGWGGSPWR